MARTLERHDVTIWVCINEVTEAEGQNEAVVDVAYQRFKEIHAASDAALPGLPSRRTPSTHVDDAFEIDLYDLCDYDGACEVMGGAVCWPFTITGTSTLSPDVVGKFRDFLVAEGARVVQQRGGSVRVVCAEVANTWRVVERAPLELGA